MGNGETSSPDFDLLTAQQVVANLLANSFAVNFKRGEPGKMHCLIWDTENCMVARYVRSLVELSENLQFAH